MNSHTHTHTCARTHTEPSALGPVTQPSWPQAPHLGEEMLSPPGPWDVSRAEVCLRPCPQPRAVKTPFVKTENPWQPAGNQAVELRPASCLEVPQRPQPSSLQSSPRTSPRAPPQTPATTAPPPSPPITRARIHILQKRPGRWYLLLSSLGAKRHSGLTQGPTAVLPPRLWKSPFACTLRRGGGQECKALSITSASGSRRLCSTVQLVPPMRLRSTPGALQSSHLRIAARASTTPYEPT